MCSILLVSFCAGDVVELLVFLFSQKNKKRTKLYSTTCTVAGWVSHLAFFPAMPFYVTFSWCIEKKLHSKTLHVTNSFPDFLLSLQSLVKYITRPGYTTFETASTAAKTGCIYVSEVQLFTCEVYWHSMFQSTQTHKTLQEEEQQKNMASPSSWINQTRQFSQCPCSSSTRLDAYKLAAVIKTAHFNGFVLCSSQTFIHSLAKFSHFCAP